MMDIIGGVNINVSKKMHYSDPYDDNGGLHIDLQPGRQLLNGKTAMEYLCYRDGEGDIGRVGRQQEFIKAVLEEIVKPQYIINLPELIKNAGSIIRTDMTLTKMLSFVTIISALAKAGLNTDTMPGALADIKEISYVIPIIKDIRQIVARNQNIIPDAQYNKITERLAREVQ